MNLPYVKPAIIYSDELSGRAVQCSKADSASCSGPITS